jgi:hypothetical protein
MSKKRIRQQNFEGANFHIADRSQIGLAVRLPKATRPTRFEWHLEQTQCLALARLSGDNCHERRASACV